MIKAADEVSINVRSDQSLFENRLEAACSVNID